jgi:hypothetical protein
MRGTSSNGDRDSDFGGLHSGHLSGEGHLGLCYLLSYEHRFAWTCIGIDRSSRPSDLCSRVVIDVVRPRYGIAFNRGIVPAALL